jgi:uncharacterized membrane protein
MNQNSYNIATGIIFLLIGLLHLLRVLYGWDAIVAGWSVPKWISWVALVVAGYFAYEGFRLRTR